MLVSEETYKRLQSENKELKDSLKANEQRFKEARETGAKRKAPDWELRFMCDNFLDKKIEEVRERMPIPWLTMNEKTRRGFYEMLLEFLDFIKERGYSIHTNNL